MLYSWFASRVSHSFLLRVVIQGWEGMFPCTGPICLPAIAVVLKGKSDLSISFPLYYPVSSGTTFTIGQSAFIILLNCKFLFWLVFSAILQLEVG